MKDFSLNDGRPAFALESYSAPSPLPHDKQLTRESELVGHTIAAMVMEPCGAVNADVVIVTETGCWLVIVAEVDDDEPILNVNTSTVRVLRDYLSAGDMLSAGLILEGEFDAIRTAEMERERIVKQQRARNLRQEADRLEAQST